jgi:hypothetical protein
MKVSFLFVTSTKEEPTKFKSHLFAMAGLKINPFAGLD